MEKKIDQDAIELAVKNILVALQDDPNREGLVDTPKRVARAYAEMFEGQLYTNHEIAEMFNKTFESDSDGMVVEKGIEVFSHCEHHLALMYNMRVGIAYLPKGRVIGLSKMARVAQMCAKRLQLQERITQDIWDVMSEILGTDDVAVFVSGEHSCMTARGVKSPGTRTHSNVLGGAFMEKPELRSEVMAIFREN